MYGFVLTAVLAAADAGPSCSESARELRYTATGDQLNAVLSALAVDLAGQKVVTRDGVTFTVRRVSGLSWRGGVIGIADVDFDYASLTGRGTLPLRVEAELDVPAQKIRSIVSLTGPIEITESHIRGVSGTLGDMAGDGFASVVRSVSLTDAFRQEFSRRAEAYARPPSIPDLVRSVQPRLQWNTRPGTMCVASARLDELSIRRDSLTLRGTVVTRTGPPDCCPGSPPARPADVLVPKPR